MGRMSGIIHVLTGCTATGKTELALRWAEANDAEIVSCDSLLFYRGMDIGTAKPTRDELVRVPHHLLDIRDVTARMDIAGYVGLARGAVADILRRGRRVLVAGGSGFYLKAFFAPVADDIEIPEALRVRVKRQLEEEGLPMLVEELSRLNPAGLGTLDVCNPRRVVRALERCLASGRSLAALQAAFAAQPGPFASFEVKLCELVREKGDLDERIERRVDQMLRTGLREEVGRLLAAGLRENPSAAGAIGYRETVEAIDRGMSDGELGGRIARNTRALVKKQRTWFKTQLPAGRKVDAAQVRPESLFA